MQYQMAVLAPHSLISARFQSSSSGLNGLRLQSCIHDLLLPRALEAWGMRAGGEGEKRGHGGGGEGQGGGVGGVKGKD